MSAFRWDRRLKTPVPLAGVVLAAIVGACQAAFAQSTYNIVYVENGFATCDQPPPAGTCGAKDNPWHGLGQGLDREPTGGIRPAIASCPDIDLGDEQSGCIVVLPRGWVTVSSTIDVSGGASRLNGLVLRGHGSGEKTVSGETSWAGTTLHWTGANDASVLRVAGTDWSVFEDFAIDAGDAGIAGGAGIGIEVTTVTINTQLLGCRKDIFRNLYISDVNGTPGIGIQVGNDDTDGQTSELLFDSIHIQNGTTGILQQGSQTTNVLYKNVQIGQFARFGMDFAGGSITTEDCVFLTDADDPQSPACPLGTPCADVRVRNITDGPGSALFQHNNHETQKGSAYLFESGTARVLPTTIIDTVVVWFQNGKIIDYRQIAPLNIIGSSFLPANQASHTGTIHIDVPAGAQTTISSFGNQYPYGDAGGVTMTFQDPNAATLIANDNPTHLPVPTASNVAHTFRNAGLVMEGGSLNWKETTGNIQLKHRLVGSSLLTLDASDATITELTSGGGLILPKDNSSLLFGIGGHIAYVGTQGTTVLAASSGLGNPSIFLPNRSGTAIVSGDTLTGDIAATLADVPPTATTIQDAAIQASDVDATNPATTGQCLTKASGDQFTWAPCDGGAPSLTSAITFHSGANLVNTTVRYMPPNSAGILSVNDTPTRIPMPAFTAKVLRCRVENPPGANRQWTFTARADGGAVLSVVISGSETSDSTPGNVSWPAGANVNLMVAPAGTPSGTTGSCSLEVTP